MKGFFYCHLMEPTCISRAKMDCRIIGCLTCAKIAKGICGWEPAAAVWMSYGGGKWKWSRLPMTGRDGPSCPLRLRSKADFGWEQRVRDCTGWTKETRNRSRRRMDC